MAVSLTTPPYTYYVGLALQALRTQHGHTKKAIADGIGMSPSSVFNHEFDRAEPTLSTIVSYCQFYQIDLATFYHLVQFTIDKRTPTTLAVDIKQLAVITMLSN